MDKHTVKPVLKVFLASSAIIIAMSACKKKADTTASTPAVSSYTSINDFYTANAPKSQTFKIDAVNGGSFTTVQGTKVTVAPGSFLATGNVNIEFEDIYKKSDMLLAQMPVMIGKGAPLVSAGEFFIKASQDSNALGLAPGGSIKVEQPAGGKIDSNMKPFVFAQNVSGGNGWVPTFQDSLRYTTSYVFSLYTFSTPVGKGTWCNSDNSTYFSGYTQTTLNILPDFVDSSNNMQVFLVFKGINSMVHIYDNGNSQYPYSYAPVGLPCTIVAVGVQHGKLYSSFTDITISANQTVNITTAVTTADDFKTKLKALDN